MNKLTLTLPLTVALTLTGSALAPAGAVVDTPLSSANVTLVGNIPDLGAVGGHVRTVNTLLGPKSYFVMSGAGGVSAYDITVPEAPVLAGHLALPHWSNEDVEVGGDIMLVSTDPQWVDWVTPAGTIGGLYILDISKLPVISFAYTNPSTANRYVPAVENSAGHTITCVRADCSYAILNGVGEVTVVDLRVPSAPKVAHRFDSAVGSTHDSQVDATGLVWMSGSGGVAAYDFSNPTDPTVTVPAFGGGLSYQHNSWRPRSSEWVPRTAGNMSAPDVRAGELIMVTEEEFYPVLQQTQCLGQGRFQTRRVRDTDALTGGATPTVDVLDTWETELQLGSISTSAVCSAHYFHERDGIVAIAWYEQGVRFLDVRDPRNIKQVGYYMNPSTAVFSVEWIGPGTTGGEIAYTLDPSRGIDILRFDRGSTSAVTAPIPPWAGAQASSGVLAGPHPKWGYACSLLS